MSRARLYAFAFIDEWAPWYALLTLWFDDHGVGAGPISTVFAVWALVALLAEVPSGALSDRVDRRRLLAGALSLRAVGMSVCLLWPSLPGALVGASLWALHTALASGTWEALVYEHLQGQGAEAEYPVVSARIGQANHLGTALGALVATTMVEAGLSIAAVGWVTVGAQGVAMALALGLPAGRGTAEHEAAPFSYRVWWATVQGGLRAAAERPLLRRVVGGCALLEGLFVLDEYVPLLGRARGADDATVPLLVLAVWVGLLLGGEVAARRPTLSPQARAALLAFGATALGVTLVWQHPWAAAGVGLTYAALNAVWVVSEAQLQAHAPEDARATVRSVVSLAANLINLALFALVGAAAAGTDPGPGLWWTAPVLVGAAVFMAGWMPKEAVDG